MSFNAPLKSASASRSDASGLQGLYPCRDLPAQAKKGDTQTVTIDNVTMVMIFNGVNWDKFVELPI